MKHAKLTETRYIIQQNETIECGSPVHTNSTNRNEPMECDTPATEINNRNFKITILFFPIYHFSLNLAANCTLFIMNPPCTAEGTPL